MGVILGVVVLVYYDWVAERSSCSTLVYIVEVVVVLEVVIVVEGVVEVVVDVVVVAVVLQYLSLCLDSC